MLDCSSTRFSRLIDARLGTGVNARRLDCLRRAIGSPRRPVLFTAIYNRLMHALAALSRQMTKDLQKEMGEILKQVGNDIEILRGTEAQMLAKDGFLEKIKNVMKEVEAQMAMISEMTAVVKAEADKNGYL